LPVVKEWGLYARDSIQDYHMWNKWMPELFDSFLH
jgi:hypothetical protein